MHQDSGCYIWGNVLKNGGFSELLASVITCCRVKGKSREIFAFIKGELAYYCPTLPDCLCIWLTLSFLSVLRWSLQAFLAERSYHHHCYRSPSLLRPCGWRVLQAEVWCWILADPPDPRGYGYHNNRRHRDAPWNKENEWKVFIDVLQMMLCWVVEVNLENNHTQHLFAKSWFSRRSKEMYKLTCIHDKGGKKIMLSSPLTYSLCQIIHIVTFKCVSLTHRPYCSYMLSSVNENIRISVKWFNKI